LISWFTFAVEDVLEVVLQPIKNEAATIDNAIFFILDTFCNDK
jgi:hypothetical protein